MWSVPLRLRSLSMSLITIAIHIFGDVPAPPIVGAFQAWLRADAPACCAGGEAAGRREPCQPPVSACHAACVTLFGPLLRLQDYLNRTRGPDINNWRWSLRLVVMALVAAVGLFALAAGLAARSGGAGGDRSADGGDRSAGALEEASDGEAATAPLLQEGGAAEGRRDEAAR